MAQKSHQITGQVVVNLDVPKNKHGIIIGKQGANIRDLQSKFSVRINIPMQNEPTNIVTIVAPSEAAAKATEEAIEKLIGMNVNRFTGQAPPPPPAKSGVAASLPKMSLDQPHIAEVLFFPDEQSAFERFLQWIVSAKQTIDVCVYTITDNRVVDALILLKSQGVKVRVITDDDKAKDLGSDSKKLVADGIPVRIDASPANMHHKFAVLDGKVLLNGSFNWTRAAALENRENVVITNDAAIVKRFADEFEHLWTLYATHNLQ